MLLALGDGETVEADTLKRVKDGRFPEHGLDSPHSTNDVFDLDVTDDGLGVLGFLYVGTMVSVFMTRHENDKYARAF